MKYLPIFIFCMATQLIHASENSKEDRHFQTALDQNGFAFIKADTITVNIIRHSSFLDTSNYKREVLLKNNKDIILLSKIFEYRKDKSGTIISPKAAKTWKGVKVVFRSYKKILESTLSKCKETNDFLKIYSSGRVTCVTEEKSKIEAHKQRSSHESNESEFNLSELSDEDTEELSI